MLPTTLADLFGGQILDEAEAARVVAELGPEHVRTCADCGLGFLSVRLASDLCHGCWYSAELDGIGSVYADVIQLLRSAEIPISVTQTGGMCMALTFPWGDGYFLLTDAEDTLSWEREESQGWALGLYDEDGEPLWEDLEAVDVPDAISVEPGVLTTPIKSADSALALALTGLRVAGSPRRGDA